MGIFNKDKIRGSVSEIDVEAAKNLPLVISTAIQLDIDLTEWAVVYAYIESLTKLFSLDKELLTNTIQGSIIQLKQGKISVKKVGSKYEIC
jgi:hypothetical protein